MQASVCLHLIFYFLRHYHTIYLRQILFPFPDLIARLFANMSAIAKQPLVSHPSPDRSYDVELEAEIEGCIRKLQAVQQEVQAERAEESQSAQKSLSRFKMASSSSNVVGVHYRVGKKVGEGSFGVIFEGTNLLNNQQVAIKFVCTMFLVGLSVS